MFKKDNVKNLREKFTPRPGKNFFGPPNLKILPTSLLVELYYVA